MPREPLAIFVEHPLGELKLSAHEHKIREYFLHTWVYVSFSCNWAFIASYCDDRLCTSVNIGKYIEYLKRIAFIQVQRIMFIQRTNTAATRVATLTGRDESVNTSEIPLPRIRIVGEILLPRIRTVGEILLPRIRTVGSETGRSRGPQLWLSFPQDIRNAQPISLFKSKITNWSDEEPTMSSFY